MNAEPPARSSRTAYVWAGLLLSLWAVCTLGADRLAPIVQAAVTDVERMLGLDTVPQPPEEPP